MDLVKGPPDFAAVAEILDVTETELVDALGITEGSNPPLGLPLANRA
jgi:hypothetical protein